MRERILQECLQKLDSCKCLVAELATGIGKSKIAIECANKICKEVFDNENDTASILIVVPRIAHIENWKEEIKKWGGLCTDRVQFCCYASLHKYASIPFDIVIFDECHHLETDRKAQLFSDMHIYYKCICLSATVSHNLKWFIKSKYQNTEIVSVTTKEAIENEVLPKPEIWLIPLVLDNTKSTELMPINTNSKNKSDVIPYSKIWEYRKNKRKAVVSLTKRQLINELNQKIDYYKRQCKGGAGTRVKNMMLKASSDRLKLLAEWKSNEVLEILLKIKDERSVTLCASIMQTKALGSNCIHSQNKDSLDILNSFNREEISHITACHMLDEGMNLRNCKYALFANINASETIQVQRVGRALRHPSPVLIIPYYKFTREEEIVKKWMENYNSEYIKTKSLMDL